jgi:hypothetical protein
MPQFDIMTFFVQTISFSLFFLCFYFFYIKFILHPTFLAINNRAKISKISLIVKMNKTLIGNQFYSRIVK